MMNEKYIDRIQELRHHTYGMNTIDLQESCSPIVKPLYDIKNQFFYWYDGYKNYIYEPDVACLALDSIPFCYPRTKECIFKKPLKQLIEDEWVQPFLLFIDGNVVKWSEITVIRDWNYSYLLLDYVPDYLSNIIMIIFPISYKKLRYGEDEDVLSAHEKAIYISENNKFIPSAKYASNPESLRVRLEFLDENDEFYFKHVPYSSNVEYLKFDGLDPGLQTSYNNIIPFINDGIIDHSSYKKGTKVPSFISSSEPWVNGPYNTYKLSPLIPGINSREYILIYFKKVNPVFSRIYNRSNDLKGDVLLGSMIKFCIDNPKPGYETDIANLLSSVSDTFDFKLDRNLDYSSNLKNAMKTITQYDYSLWNDTYIRDSYIQIFTYTGEEFLAIGSDGGVKLSRKHSDLIEDVCMVFVNSKLYKYTDDITFRTGTINIPTFGIRSDDLVEIILFKRCNNNIFDIIIPSDSTEIYLHPEYNMNDCYLMHDEYEGAEYPNTPNSPDGKKQFLVHVESVTPVANKKNTYNIRLKEPQFYNKKIKVVPKNQFRHYKFKKLNQTVAVSLTLPTSFNYCHDMYRYMIFVNNRKISRAEYTLTIPNENRPFDEIKLYISTILDKNDTVDVFYLPEILISKYFKSQADINGVINLKNTFIDDDHINAHTELNNAQQLKWDMEREISNYPKLYSFSKKTCLVFVNGYLIHPYHIKDVSMTRMIIHSKLKNRLNVEVMEFIHRRPHFNDDEFPEKYLLNPNIDGTLPGLKNHLYDTWYYIIEQLCDSTSKYIEGATIVEKVLDGGGVAEKIRTIVNGGGVNVDPNNPGIADGSGMSVILPNNAGLMLLYGVLENIYNPEKSYKEDYVPLKTVLYEVIRDYFMNRQGVTSGDPFVYDFETKEFSPLGNTNVLDLDLFPEKDKIYDYSYIDHPASDEDVLKNIKYIPLP